METRTIGSLQIPVVGVGCNHLGVTVDEAGTLALVDAALGAGVTFFDTADEYGTGMSEQHLGKALKGRRDRAIIATKFGIPFGGDPQRGGGSARWVTTAVEESLRRLGTDYVDLYQLHFPDPQTPIEETLTALDRLKRDGKVREFGCSNFTNELIDEAAGVAASKGLHMFSSAQNELNLLRQQAVQTVLPACERHGLGVLPYFPLASGMLTGKYRRGEPPPGDSRLAISPYLQPGVAERMMSDKRFDRIEALDAFAQARGHTLLELAMGWLLAQPTVACIIAGATKPAQVVANVEAAGWQLTPREASEAAAIAGGRG
jgi:aryl-alcohol dehydrogenase-like predicted oxidoreductase